MDIGLLNPAFSEGDLNEQTLTNTARSVHPTDGILRDLQAFSQRRVYTDLKPSLIPPASHHQGATRRVTHAVEQLLDNLEE